MTTTPELSAPEIRVAEWLIKHGILFEMQVNMFGGVSQAGGAKVDFVLPDKKIILRVQSYWHTAPEAEARDNVQKIYLTSLGYTVVDVWEDDIEKNIDRIMKMAVEGIER